MASHTRIEVHSRIPEIIAQSEVKAAAAVSATGLGIVAGAQGRVVENRSVDTGNLLNSIEWRPGDDAFSGEVTVGAHYGIYVENGSVHPERAYRNREGELDLMGAYTIPAKPFLAPSVEDARGPFEAAVSQLYD